MDNAIKKTGIRLQVFICVVLAFFGFINAIALIWMAGKTKKKWQQRVGIISLILCIAGVLFVGVVKNETIIMVVTGIVMAALFIPIPIILISIRDFMSCQTLMMFMKKHSIDIQRISEDDFSNIKVYPDNLTEKNSQRLFGDKWRVTLKAIQYKENEQRIIKENEKKEKLARKKETEIKKTEIRKAEAEARKAEQEKKLRLQTEAETRRIEIKKAEAEQAKAEALRLQAEAEARKVELKSAEIEQVKAEALKLQAETEARRIAIMKVEAERAKAEAQKLQAEAEIKKIELEKNKELKYMSQNIETNSNKYAEKIEKIDINFCTEQELSLIQGIGIILAKKAIQIRNQKGRFQSVDEFMREVGIRESNKAAVKKYLMCTEQQAVGENNTRKYGRKIDL